MNLNDAMNTPTQINVGHMTISVAVLAIKDLAELDRHMQAIARNLVYEPGAGINSQPDAVRTSLLASMLGRADSLTVLAEPRDSITADLRRTIMWSPQMVTKRIVLGAARAGVPVDFAAIHEKVNSLTAQQYHDLVDVVVNATIDHADPQPGKVKAEVGAAASSPPSSPPADDSN